MRYPLTGMAVPMLIYSFPILQQVLCSIYEYLIDEIGKNTSMTYTRDEIKDMTYKILFSRNSSFYQEFATPKRIFASIMPDLYHFLCLFKEYDHSLLARSLQRIESCFILDIVATRIISERPQMGIFTVHDSIVFPVGNEEYVKNVIIDEADKHFGCHPKLKAENWF